MLLTALLATLAAAAGALANTSTAWKASSPTNSSSFVKSSTFKSTPSLKASATSSTSVKNHVPSVSPLIAALSTMRSAPKVKSAPPLKSQSATPHTRPVPHVARMISIKTPTSKPVILSLMITAYDPAKLPSYDYDEPDDLRNKLGNELAGKINKHFGESQNLLGKSVDDDGNGKQVTSVQQNVSIVFEENDEDFLKDLKDNLKRGNDDYLERLSGRRKGNNIEIARPKHVDLTSLDNIKQIRSKSQDRARRTHTLSTRTRSKMRTITTTAKDKMIWFSESPGKPPGKPPGNPPGNPPSSQPVRRRIGLTTPSKYEIKSYRKQRKHRRRPHGGQRPVSTYLKHKNRGNDLYNRDRSYHVQRRHDLRMSRSTKEQLLKSIEITMPEDLASDLMLQPITEDATSVRTRPYSQLQITNSVATRPTVYEVTTKSTTQRTAGKIWNSQPTPSTQKSYTLGPEDKRMGRNGNSLTTISGFERDSSKKQKKLERFVKFINKNRSLLRQFIKEKKDMRAGDKKAMFRDGVNPVKQANHELHLDLSPGKGNRIEVMRYKGRICQRNVMIPEGPKYNSQGQTYMPAFKRRKNGPDYPATKRSRFIIPACCNCCKKSVLGCQ